MVLDIQAIRGMSDILPDETPYWQRLEHSVRRLLTAYGYDEIRIPLLEKTELFARSIGEVTDIVEKEMYTFADRNGDSLTLRPEGTAGCVRAAIQNGLTRTPQRLWYSGPMFRHERPQKGRYRQFHQVGVEAFGIAGPDIDAEIILMSARLWRDLGLDGLTLELNSLGTAETRATYREHLVAFLSKHRGDLDEDSLRRLHTNPLRVLDSKNPDMQALIREAPRLVDHLDPESATHFEGLQRLLTGAGVTYTLNTRLVRGLDYYGKTVFEWTTDRLGAQATVCAGGRYDGLVEQLGGPPTPAVGFAMGLERIVSLVRESTPTARQSGPHAYLVLVGEAALQAGFRLAERLRDHAPDLRLSTNCGGGSFKSQMKRADRSGAEFALLLGDDEVRNGVVSLKPLRVEGEQRSMPIADLEGILSPLLATARMAP